MGVSAYPGMSDEKFARLRSEYKRSEEESTARFQAKSNAEFRAACEAVEVQPTPRQFRAWKNKRGRWSR
jgi:hypothetical protein